MIFTSMDERVYIVTYTEPGHATPCQPIWKAEARVVARSLRHALAKFNEENRTRYACALAVREVT